MFKRTALIAAAVATVGFPLLAVASPAQADPKHNFIFGTLGDDNLVGTKKSDIIIGFQGNDTIIGGKKNDALLGGRGDDVLTDSGKHSGTDLLRGGPGNDTCYVDATDRTIGCETIIVQ
jgi:Ca2+-binding RTX toxin-like protein